MTPKKAIEASPWWSRVTQIGDLKAREVEWAIEQLIPMGSVVLFAGAYATYKSWLARDACRGIASGDQFAGFECPKPRSILYLDRENSESQVARSWKAKHWADELSADFTYFGDWVELPQRREILDPGSSELAEWADARQGVIVFDTLTRFHNSKENDNIAMARVMEKFVALARRGVAVVILHHRGKNKESVFRGAEDIVGAVDIAYAIERTGAADIELKQIKNRMNRESSWSLTLREGRFRQAGAV